MPKLIRTPSLKLGHFLFGLAILLFFIYLFLHFGELQQIPQLFLKLKWYIIVFLVFFEFLFLLNRGVIFKILYKIFGININLAEMTKLFTASYTLNVLTPSAGWAGMALMMSEAKKNGYSRIKILLVNALFYFTNYSSILILFIATLLYLIFSQKIAAVHITTLSILTLILIFVLVLVLIIFYNKKASKAILIFFKNLGNFFLRIFKMVQIEDKKITDTELEISKLKKIISTNKIIFYEILLQLFVGNFIEILTIYLILINFNVSYPIIASIITYSVGLLFMLASITPSGIGIVEPIMTVTFMAFGISLEISAITTIIFRAITFWLPLPFGVIILKKYFK